MNLIVEDGSIVNPNVHDANILGVIMLTQKQLLLPIETVDGLALYIALDDVVCLRVDDFREGNIILDISVLSGTEVEMKDIAYAHGLESFLSCQSNSFLEKAIQNFLSRKQYLVQVNPSYGCKLVCICNKVEVLENWIPKLPFCANP
jgi:hypothetical protein